MHRGSEQRADGKVLELSSNQLRIFRSLVATEDEEELRHQVEHLYRNLPLISSKTLALFANAEYWQMTQKVAIKQKEQAGEGGLEGQDFMHTLGDSLASKRVFDIATCSTCSRGEGQATWEYNWSASDLQSDESEEEDVTNKKDQGMDWLNPEDGT